MSFKSSLLAKYRLQAVAALTSDPKFNTLLEQYADANPNFDSTEMTSYSRDIFIYAKKHPEIISETNKKLEQAMFYRGISCIGNVQLFTTLLTTNKIKARQDAVDSWTLKKKFAYKNINSVDQVDFNHSLLFQKKIPEDKRIIYYGGDEAELICFPLDLTLQDLIGIAINVGIDEANAELLTPTEFKQLLQEGRNIHNFDDWIRVVLKILQPRFPDWVEHEKKLRGFVPVH